MMLLLCFNTTISYSLNLQENVDVEFFEEENPNSGRTNIFEEEPHKLFVNFSLSCFQPLENKRKNATLFRYIYSLFQIEENVIVPPPEHTA